MSIEFKNGDMFTSTADNKKWPTDVFLPTFKRVQERFKWRRITSRRIAKITKGVLAAQAALSYSLSEHDRRHNDEATVEATSGRAD